MRQIAIGSLSKGDARSLGCANVMCPVAREINQVAASNRALKSLGNIEIWQINGFSLKLAPNNVGSALRTDGPGRGFFSGVKSLSDSAGLYRQKFSGFQKGLLVSPHGRNRFQYAVPRHLHLFF